MNSKLEEYLQERVQDFSETYLKVDPRTVKATFPWGRLFETDITVYDKPVVPLQKENSYATGSRSEDDKLKLQQLLLRLHKPMAKHKLLQLCQLQQLKLHQLQLRQR